jgi:hypothetical protein
MDSLSIFLAPPGTDENLRLLVRQKLHDGRLPHHGMKRSSIDPGGTKSCDGCEERITKAQVVQEVVLTGGRGMRGSIQFHLGCFQVWDHERRAA